MADQENTSLIFDQSLLQSFFGIHIQVVGRLVQKQDICFFVYQFAQTHLCLFTTAQYTHLALDMLGSKPAFCKSGPYFILSIRRKFRPDLINTGSFVVSFYFLFTVSDLKILSKFAGTL